MNNLEKEQYDNCVKIANGGECIGLPCTKCMLYIGNLSYYQQWKEQYEYETKDTDAKTIPKDREPK